LWLAWATPSCRLRCRCEPRGVPFPVHLRNRHGPCGRGEVQKERSTGLFAIVVVRRPDGRFLMVQEFANSGFWVPGGQVDAGESLRAAVVRETEEEAGVAIELRGLIDVQTERGGRWKRITFLAVPASGAEAAHPPKTLPDYESAGAVSPSEGYMAHLNITPAPPVC